MRVRVRTRQQLPYDEGEIQQDFERLGREYEPRGRERVVAPPPPKPPQRTGGGPRIRVKVPKGRSTNEDRELEMALRRRAAEAKAKLHELCRSDINAFCEYVMRDDLTGQPVEQSDFHLQLQRDFDRHRQIVVMSHPESGKALPLSTEIPTPDGWTTMGELRVGDMVFGGDGQPCWVTFATEVQHGHRLFALTFDDGVTIKADSDHQWLAIRRSDAKCEVLTTSKLAEDPAAWSVPLCKPIRPPPEAVEDGVDLFQLGWDLASADCDDQKWARASVAQREQVIRGLIEASGTHSGGRGCLTFDTEALAHKAAGLLRAQGYWAAVRDAHEECWRVRFRSDVSAKKLVSIREVASEPVRCIQVDSSDHTYLCDRSYTVTHNTNQMAIARVLFELGNNPNLRVMLLYNAEDSAMKTLSTIRRYVESSAELQAVFPNLKRGEIWKDDSIVVARTAYSRDPSVVAVGYNSRRIQGSRVDMVIIDDLLDALVTATEGQRKKLSSWVKNTVLTRLTEKARVAFLTNAWHPRDLAHELVKDRGWHLLRRPIRDPNGQIWWKKWSEERLATIKRSLGALEYARSFECDPRDDGTRVFRPEHVEFALTRGRGYGFLRSVEMLAQDCIIVTGVDLAAAVDDSKTQGAKTVLTSVFFHPNKDRQVVRIRAGRMRAIQILRELAAVAQAFPYNHWIVVENNGVQRWILELASQNEIDVGVALVPFQTGKNKADPRFGVASMAAEFESRHWILPSSCYDPAEQEHVAELVSQMIDYVPEAHTGDYLMSLWFAREIGRRIFARFAGTPVDGGGRGSAVRAIG